MPAYVVLAGSLAKERVRRYLRTYVRAYVRTVVRAHGCRRTWNTFPLRPSSSRNAQYVRYVRKCSQYFFSGGRGADVISPSGMDLADSLLPSAGTPGGAQEVRAPSPPLKLRTYVPTHVRTHPRTYARTYPPYARLSVRLRTYVRVAPDLPPSLLPGVKVATPATLLQKTASSPYARTHPRTYARTYVRPNLERRAGCHSEHWQDQQIPLL